MATIGVPWLRNFSATRRRSCRIAFGDPVDPDEKRINPGSPGLP